MVKLDISNAREVRLNQYLISVIDAELGDSFNFGCMRCGECCALPPGVNPKEVSELSNLLGISKPEFLQRYTEFHESTTESLRRMGLTSDEILRKYPEFYDSPKYGWKVVLARKNNHCVFLKKGDAAYCEVHEASPRQCRARPIIGRFNPFLRTVNPEEMSFTINPCQGFGTGPEYTVREWIERNGLKEMWQDELDYLHTVKSIKPCKPLQLKSEIRKLYVK